jgi:hypothetical protein
MNTKAAPNMKYMVHRALGISDCKPAKSLNVAKLIKKVPTKTTKVDILNS